MKALIGCTLLALVLAACGNSSTEADGPPGETAEGTVTESGLRYIEVEAGEGIQPKTGHIVAVHYTGRLENGTEFDSSHKRGEPYTFALGHGKVIAGWDEGVALMRQGGKARLVIPPHLGYGQRGAGGVIPPNATLIFDLELVEVR